MINNLYRISVKVGTLISADDISGVYLYVPVLDSLPLKIHTSASV